MAQIPDLFKKHYKKTFIEHGPTAQGVDWKNKDEANIRYKIILNIIRNNNTSLLDVGCGYGGLLKYSKKEKININYTGIDLVKEMINEAKKQNPKNKFINANILEYNPKNKFDYVIANGLLTQKLSSSNKEMEKFMFDLINKMWDISKEGIAFNILTTQVDFKNKGNFYYDPAKMIKYTSNFSRFFKIHHDYPMFEYTFFLYKKPI